MANVIVTLKIMPESPDVSLSKIEADAKKEIVDFAGEGDIKAKQEEVAFGLKALNLIFVMDESKGSTEKLEDKLKDMDGIRSVEVTDMRRAVG